VIYLEKAEILWINKTFILDKGGSYYEADDNVLNRNSFEYMIDAPKSILYGEELYEDVYEKAAVYPFLIINDHIFHDGNKRTGMMAALLFLAKNGLRVRTVVTSPMVVFYAEKIAEKHLNIRRIANWLRIYSEPGYL
jgi:death-on-curing protein